MKTAVILFNLGGPDAPASVGSFLFNLFSDPAIIALPNPLRWLVAKVISGRRAPVAREIYARLGGGSPILVNTEAQARGLEELLGSDYRVFIAMRYWHPRAAATVRQVKGWGAERIILLPLYPQYSTTTTASSVKEWMGACRSDPLDKPTSVICCYPREAGFVSAVAERVRQGLAALPADQVSRRVLFSAHGLPQKIVDSGDPYPWQVEQTVSQVVAALDLPGLDYTICYQSRVGPMKWLSPSTDAQIRRAGREGCALVVVPIAFVSEHSETLVELDIEYKHLADASGVPAYIRVPTVDAQADFLGGLASMVQEASADMRPLKSCEGDRLCPLDARRCAFRELATILGV